MSDDNQVGKIGWIDITVDDATGLRDFYKAVVGWTAEDVKMGDYSDYSMAIPDTDEAVTGICHARGSNASLRGGWLIYIIVEDVEASAAACVAHGGKVVVDPRALSGGTFCVIEDPSGATAALYQG
ncbi:MAG: VOC family protein [Gammaproteobacteria bacterium]|nr:VOC family protein [Gammaproteobacteria bacterium]NNC56752.1 VOC family protein [Woeseiaceae bacterium]NNL49635.1 VOC family protein [Woeseiaceae bacterium]